METQVLLFCLMGGLVSADTDAAGQVMISQPLVSCSLAGALLGNLILGLTVGVLLELPFLVEVPAGGSKVSLGNLGAYVAAGLAIQLNQLFPNQMNLTLMLSVMFGLFLSWATVQGQRWMRQLNLLLLYRADREADTGNLSKITLLNYLGVLNAFFFGLVFSAIFLFFGKVILTFIIQILPLQWDPIFWLSKAILLGAGMGAFLWLFSQKSSIKYTIFGAGFSAAFLIVSSIG